MNENKKELSNYKKPFEEWLETPFENGTIKSYIIWLCGGSQSPTEEVLNLLFDAYAKGREDEFMEVHA